ncbi:hypothetical protein K431DRAFT_216930 [Polychaeton citri CBS 116435]|uniref:C3H1-type domain-containing protein n=1 Tax=Polychaeton citri CBS 116435 TaxID=1314669 RepID=A0A9P4QH90_9PEZI|nr:hypothetical protein K431DRAFT_216930 [Polychaeton citri CBS 116435]
MQRRDPFVLVLIDGDGMVFDNVYLREGEAGGKKAAADLHDAVAQWATKEMEFPEDTRIVARIYANLDGLADVCARAGLVENPTRFQYFARGLTRGKTGFDFVDVGPGKDRADAKICSGFRLHLYDYHCRQILLGCSHDNGYARLLDEYTSDDKALHRVTLLEGVPFGKELDVLPFSKKKLGTIFRESKINLSPRLGHLDVHEAAVRRPSATLKPTSSPFMPVNGVMEGSRPATPITTYVKNMSDTTQSNHARHLPLAPSTPLSEHLDKATTSWVTVVRSGKKPVHSQNITTTSQPNVNATEVKPVVIRRNRKGQRIDPALTQYDDDDFKRLKAMKLCNRHYLLPDGCHIDHQTPGMCTYRHDLKLNKAQMNIIRAVARETPCRNGTGCDDVHCMQGHHCPFPKATEGSMRGLGCQNVERCAFPREMHGVDNNPVRLVDASGGLR